MNKFKKRAGGVLRKTLSITLSIATVLWMTGVMFMIPVSAASHVSDGDLIRGPDGVKVYIVNNKGFKRHIFNPAVFDLYGHFTWSDINDVDQTTVDSYTTSDIYRADGDSKVYQTSDDGVKKWFDVTAAEFVSMGYSWDQVFVVNASERDYYSTGTAIVSGETTPAPTGNTLSAALASDNPAATQIIADGDDNQYPQAAISFAKFTFVAGTSDSKVTQLQFERVGIASDSDLGNLYLYEGSTKLAEYNSFSSKILTFTNSAGLFTVSAGSSKTITLKGDLARGSTSVTSGKTIGFKLASSSSITTDGATVSGSFPISGNTMETASVTDLGGVYFTAYTTYPATVKADASNQELWRFSLTADSQDVEVRYLKLSIVGTIAASDISNVKLEVGGVQVGSAIASISGDKVLIFDLASSPISIPSGQTKVVVLRGDMTGGAGRTFKFTIQRVSDTIAYDTNYGVFVTAAKDSVIGAFGIIQPTASTSVDSGTITNGVATDSPSGNIADAGTNMTFAKFSFEATGETVKIDNLDIKLNYTGTVTANLKNVKLLLDGSQIGSTASTVATSTGTVDQNYTFGNTFQIAAGQTKYITVVGDLTHSGVGVDDTFSISLVVGSSNAQGQTTLASLGTSAQTARTLTVKSGSLTVTKNTSFGDKDANNPTGTVNATARRIGSFVITAGSGEAVDVTQITLKDASSATALGNNFQNLMIKSGGIQIGTTISSLNTTTSVSSYSFTPSSAIRVNAGQQYVVDVYADVKSTVADSATSLSPVVKVDSVTATGVSTSTDATDSDDRNLQTAYVVASGSLTVTTGSDTPIAAQIVMGTTDVTLATFKLAADAAEDIDISEITVSDVIDLAATGTLQNLKLYVDGSQVGQTIQFGSTSTSTYANAVFSGLTLQIPKNQSKTLTVKGDVTLYDNGGVSNSTHTFALLVDKDATTGSGESITALGASSGVTITASALNYGASPDVDQTANAMTVYRTKVSVAYASDSPSGASSGQASQIVAKINVSNSSTSGNYTATVNTMNFNIATTISNTSARTLTVYKDSTSTTYLATTSWDGVTENFSDTNFVLAGDFVDFTIASGGTKLIIVVLDTTEATSNENMSISIGTGDVTWSDGATTSTTVNDLPLLSKTFTY